MDGAGSSLERAVPSPRLFPQWRNRAALGVIYALWALLMAGSALSTQKHVHFLALLDAFVLPLTHLGAFALIAPLPWILWQGKPSFLNFLKGLALSLVTCETTAVLLVLIDSLILRKAGAPFSLWRIIVLYASLVGPGMMLVGGLMAAHARSEDEREAARSEALVAKTRLLQSQVHPHVLFNALNGLAELIHRDPPRAERSVMHLADLMRRIMRASDRPTFPLREERAVVADFLALETMRLGSRLRVTWDWDPALDSLELPPLLVQPLVENAIKHGISPSLTGGDLLIRLRREDQDLRLEVWNTGAPLRPGPTQGLGIKNLAARLQLSCGPSATLNLGPHQEGTLASIRLPGALVKFSHETSPHAGGG